MWLRLLKNNANIGQMIKPQLMDGKWRKPLLSGRQKAELKQHFKAAGVPWIWENERPEVHETSVYNKKPKPTLKDRAFEGKIAMIRKNLST